MMFELVQINYKHNQTWMCFSLWHDFKAENLLFLKFLNQIFGTLLQLATAIMWTWKILATLGRLVLLVVLFNVEEFLRMSLRIDITTNK